MYLLTNSMGLYLCLLCFIIRVYYTLDVFTKIDLKTKTIILLLWIQNANLKIIINHMK